MFARNARPTTHTPTTSVLDNDKGNGHNALTGKPLSDGYFAILETRRKLPVHEARAELLSHLAAHQVLVLVGETGSGKTTQVPQFLVDAGYNAVACTQPRRVAALSVAKRVAVEMDVPLGGPVGYSIRFDDRSTPETVLKYLTDGMLLREAMSDPDLRHYAAIILDEAHERTLSTDVLMGLLKDVLRRRPDLKLIVMSATLDAGKFQDYFAGAPLMQVPGRVFPVGIKYTPRPVDNYVDAAVEQVVRIVAAEPPGDVLVFLTGEEEIEEACKRIRDDVRALPPPACTYAVDVLPLYSSLPPAKQQRVFERAPPPRTPGGVPGRKVICSTNVAETSITIPDIVYVVDAGRVKRRVARTAAADTTARSRLRRCRRRWQPTRPRRWLRQRRPPWCPTLGSQTTAPRTAASSARPQTGCRSPAPPACRGRRPTRPRQRATPPPPTPPPPPPRRRHLRRCR